IPGAVPALFVNAFAVRGIIAWPILLSAIGIFLLLNILLTSLRIFSLITRGDLKNFDMHVFVMSSGVGPRPPVTITISNFLQESLNELMISFSESDTERCLST